MPQQTVSGAINFTPGASPAAGGFCALRLVADGSHAPTFSGFKQSDWSKSYVNNAGALNVIEFWYDGTDAWYSVSQQTATQPNFVSAQITSASSNIVAISFASTLNTGVVPAASAFSVTASGGAASVSSVALSGSAVSLTLSRNIAAGETVTVSYAAPGSNALIDSTNTYQTASFTNQTVTNNVSSAPIVSSAQIANASPNIIAATFSANLNASSAPAASAFSVTASGGAASASSLAISGAILSLTLSRNIASGETVAFSYTAPGSSPLQNSGGTANVASFSSQSVTNNVTGGNSLGSVLRMTSLTSITESADATFSYDYAVTTPGSFAGYASGAYAGSGTALPASSDGYFGIKVGALSTNAGNAGCPPCIGFKATAGANNYSTMVLGVYGNSSAYALLGGGTVNTTLVPTVGDLMRLRRAGSTVYFEVSRNSGTSYTTVGTWTGVTTAALYADFDMFSVQSANQVFSSSNWA